MHATVKKVHFDGVLNAVWAIFGLCALLCLARNAFKRRAEIGRPPIWLHVIGVALIVAALFPYISATDDVLRVEHLDRQHHTQDRGNQSRSDSLLRLFEVLDSPLAAECCEVSFTAFFVCFFLAPAPELLERAAPGRAGRSPPLFTLA